MGMGASRLPAVSASPRRPSALRNAPAPEPGADLRPRRSALGRLAGDHRMPGLDRRVRSTAMSPSCAATAPGLLPAMSLASKEKLGQVCCASAVEQERTRNARLTAGPSWPSHRGSSSSSPCATLGSPTNRIRVPPACSTERDELALRQPTGSCKKDLRLCLRSVDAAHPHISMRRNLSRRVKLLRFQIGNMYHFGSCLAS